MIEKMNWVGEINGHLVVIDAEGNETSIDRPGDLVSHLMQEECASDLQDDSHPRLLSRHPGSTTATSGASGSAQDQRLYPQCRHEFDAALSGHRTLPPILCR